MGARILMCVAAAPALASIGFAAELKELPELGIKLSPDFQATLYADADLANDTYAMTLDSRGRVVVTTQGSIKTLLDTNNDGRADSAALLTRTATGAMGLCFDGNQLYYFADNGLWRVQDKNMDGIADAPPERLMEAKFREHGGHAMRRGPDGFWYFVAGNESELTPRHVTAPLSPITEPIAGALFRITPDGRRAQIIAHGFRNQYDFDFNWRGSIFTWDSDVERDYILPWYSPTRLYHVSYGGHHGWQLDGWVRSWNRPGYYIDTVDVLSEMGRGSPTGVASYRHNQFPEKYQDGLFLADWTFGRIFFSPLEKRDASYSAEPELFIEPIGSHGFAPTDLAVSPDGSLFISIGGRKTRGSVYQITHKSFRPKRWPETQAEFLKKPVIDQILDAPQPLDAWSRAQWMPKAKTISARSFAAAALDDGRSEKQRVRALEVVTELFGPLSREDAFRLSNSKSEAVRERLGWMMARGFPQNGKLILTKLAADRDPAVRVAALNSIQETIRNFTWTDLKGPFTSCLEHPDKRVRQAAAQVMAALPLRDWNDAMDEMRGLPPQSFLTAHLAAAWRRDQKRDLVVEKVLASGRDLQEPGLILETARLLMIALGDWQWIHPSMEGYTAYELAGPKDRLETYREPALQLVHSKFPGSTREVNVELSRLLAMLNDSSADGPAKLRALLTTESDPTMQFHYLTVLSKLEGKWPAELPKEIAGIVLSFDERLKGKDNRPKQNWSIRLNEVLARLIKLRPILETELLAGPNFISSEHLLLADVISPEARRQAAEAFFERAQDPQFPWTPQLVALLSMLPTEQVRPAFHAHWKEFGIRENIVLALSRAPVEADTPLFLEAMSTGHPAMIRTCLEALATLDVALKPNDLRKVAGTLLDSLTDPKDSATRTLALRLIEKQSQQTFGIPPETPSSNLRQLYRPVFQWFESTYPDQWTLLQNPDKRLSEWMAQWQRIDWNSGRVKEGKTIFNERACASCHANVNSLGPDLKGASSRYSVEDLFTSIAWPSREVAPNYRPWTFQMNHGQTYTGFVAFESADGVIVQTGPATTVRLPNDEIVSRNIANVSLMPEGLLDDLKDQDLADLYAYLKSL
ncbi:MAG: DUF7133 domain-containing protein [Verrucomicrobiales bacterium]